VREREEEWGGSGGGMDKMGKGKDIRCVVRGGSLFSPKSGGLRAFDIITDNRGKKRFKKTGWGFKSAIFEKKTCCARIEKSFKDKGGSGGGQKFTQKFGSRKTWGKKYTPWGVCSVYVKKTYISKGTEGVKKGKESILLKSKASFAGADKTKLFYRES